MQPLPDSPVGPPPPPPANVPLPPSAGGSPTASAPSAPTKPGAAARALAQRQVQSAHSRFHAVRKLALILLAPALIALIVVLSGWGKPEPVEDLSHPANGPADIDPEDMPDSRRTIRERLSADPRLRDVPADLEFAALRVITPPDLIHHGPAPGEQQPVINAPEGAEVVIYNRDQQDSPGDLQGWLHQGNHRNGSTIPAVVFLHSGFTLTADDWEHARPFRELGWMVLAPALRGENGNSGRFEYLGSEAADVVAALDYCWNTFYVDRERIFLVGNREGGSLAMVVAMLKTRARHVVVVNGDANCRATALDGRNVFRQSRNQDDIRSPGHFPYCLQSPTTVYLFDDPADRPNDPQMLFNWRMQTFTTFSAEAAAADRPALEVVSGKRSMKDIASWLEKTFRIR